MDFELCMDTAPMQIGFYASVVLRVLDRDYSALQLVNWLYLTVCPGSAVGHTEAFITVSIVIVRTLLIIMLQSKLALRVNTIDQFRVNMANDCYVVTPSPDDS